MHPNESLKIKGRTDIAHSIERLSCHTILTQALPMLAHVHEGIHILKPRATVTRSPKQGHQWPHKKDSWPQFFSYKNAFQ